MKETEGRGREMKEREIDGARNSQNFSSFHAKVDTWVLKVQISWIRLITSSNIHKEIVKLPERPQLDLLITLRLFFLFFFICF